MIYDVQLPVYDLRFMTDSSYFILYLPFFPLLTGWILDLVFGDPERLPHPVVGFGRWISFCEHRLNHGSHRVIKGAVVAVISILLTYGMSFAALSILARIIRNIAQLPYGSSVVLLCCLLVFASINAVIIFFCLAGHTLRREVRMAFEALDRGLEEGRRQVARIVGRDTGSLSAGEVRTAALETLAENLSDGVVAPVFWLCILGVPGMLAYKMVNTLDSMIGYHSMRYKEFGCWAARIDDVANYIPARITALLMVLVGWIYNMRLKSHTPHPTLLALLRFVIKNGPKHASPNSGWPEAALAGILDCRFGGPHDYFGEIFHKPYIGENPRSLTTGDMRVSIRICFAAECLCVAIAIMLSFIKTSTGMYMLNFFNF